MKKIFVFILIAFCYAVINAASQQPGERYLEIRGRAELDMQPLNGATVTLYEGNSVVKTAHTGSDGMFDFKLEINKYYVVEVGKKNYISKRLAFDTKLPDEEAGIWVREFAIGVVKNCEGVDYSELSEPVDIIRFNNKKRDFESDRTYLSKMRSKIDNILIENDNCVSDKYNKLLKEADRLFNQKSYDQAKEKYAAASELFPNEEYPGKKLDEIAQMQAKQENIENLYDRTIGEAEALMAQNKPEEALMKYKGAMTLKPQEPLPRQKVNEIEALIAKKQAEQQSQSAQEARYNNLITRANTEMNNKNYEAAKQLYQSALQLKPGDQSLGIKISQLDNLMAEQANRLSDQKAKDGAYNNAIAAADNLYQIKDYKGAAEAYNKALMIKPDELYPKQRISQIDNTLAANEAQKHRETEAGYQTALTAAEKSVAAKDYQTALGYYQQALQFKPDDQALKSKVAETERLISQENLKKQRQESIQVQYQAAIQKADQLLAAKNLAGAKSAYQEAQGIIPDEPYPAQQIREIERQIMAEQSKKQQQIQEEYQNAVATGNALIVQKQYQQARESFQKALGFKPDDVIAKNKILEIDNLIKQEEAKSAALQAKKNQYDGLIAKADNLYKSKNYTEAKIEYRKALQIMPDQSYPGQKIAEIDRIMAEQQKLAAEQQAKENAYRLTISKADDLFNGKQYDLSKAEYNNALSIKPGEIYPKNRITEIDNLVAREQQARTREENYTGTIAEADRLFGAKSYDEAKTAYTKALSIKPNEVYPRSQISKIDNLLAEAQKQRSQQLAIQKQYDSYIAQADKLFAAKNYPQAKDLYQKALDIKPEEEYPKSRIARIDEIYALVAEQKRKQSESSGTSVQKPATGKKIAPAELKFRNESEREQYFANLRKEYPEGVTAEVYKEQYKITTRYIIIRGNEVKELREIHYLTYGGRQHSMNGNPITQMYYESQIKPRSGEYFKKIEY